MNPCKITEDLLPLYVDDSLNNDSREFVEQHLKECESCRKLHESMNKSVQPIMNSRKAKESFRLFKRRLLPKRILLIALCVLIALIPLGILAYDTYSSYQFSQYWPRPARIEPIVSTVSRLSDGSIHLTLQYTDNDVFVNSYSTSLYHLDNPFTDDDIIFEDDGTFYIQPGYSPIKQKDKRDLDNNRVPQEYIIATAESYPKYEQPRGVHGGFDQPYTRIVLIGSDGERVLWEEGDELPAADIQAEAELARMIDGVWFVPADSSDN